MSILKITFMIWKRTTFKVFRGHSTDIDKFFVLFMNNGESIYTFNIYGGIAKFQLKANIFNAYHFFKIKTFTTFWEYLHDKYIPKLYFSKYWCKEDAKIFVSIWNFAITSYLDSFNIFPLNKNDKIGGVLQSWSYLTHFYWV